MNSGKTILGLPFRYQLVINLKSLKKCLVTGQMLQEATQLTSKLGMNAGKDTD